MMTATVEAFDFLAHWYPIAPVEDLDPERPMPIILLGQRLVVWRSRQTDTYQVFKDYCPHRLAPLSEGRVDEQTDRLMCSYHGWQFDAVGTCAHVPQAENPELIAQKKDYYCAIALPTQIANQILWVWPNPDTKALAAETPLPLSPQVDTAADWVTSSLVRDLAYDWQTLVENITDPAHVQFAHHGLQGNRAAGRPIPIEIVEANRDRIAVTVDRQPQTRITFHPPCHVEYEIEFGPGRQLGLIAYCVPTEPGKSRLVAQFSRNFAQRLHHWTPRWWTHLKVRLPVLDGDMILLHQQERLVQAIAPKQAWQTAYKLPTQSDRMVLEFRRWLDRYVPDLPWGSIPVNLSDSLSDRRALLDRYHQHTQICRSCQGALTRIHQLQRGLLGYFALGVAIAAILPDSVRLGVGLPLVGTGLLGLAVFAGLKYRLEPQFYFVDYVHAERE
jgi:phenylpropionate dioxygenase-like ring-hydroxylating dioxygenase large terminal subunit